MNKLPSVSKILIPLTKEGLKGIPKDILEQARIRGNVVGDTIQNILKGESIDYKNAFFYKEYINQFMKFIRVDHNYANTHNWQCEVVFSSPDYQGRVDFLYEGKESKYLIEMKLTYQIQLTHWLQLYAYSVAFPEYDPYLLHIKRRKDKTGKYIYSYEWLSFNALKQDKKDNIKTIWDNLVSLYKLSEIKGYSTIKDMFKREEI